MKQMMFSSVLRIVACVPALCASVPTFGVAAQVQYIYDDMGRLSQVIDGQGLSRPRLPPRREGMGRRSKG
jgi:hypothetical protein